MNDHRSSNRRHSPFSSSSPILGLGIYKRRTDGFIFICTFTSIFVSVSLWNEPNPKIKKRMNGTSQRNYEHIDLIQFELFHIISSFIVIALLLSAHQAPQLLTYLTGRNSDSEALMMMGVWTTGTEIAKSASAQSNNFIKSQTCLQYWPGCS